MLSRLLGDMVGEPYTCAPAPTPVEVFEWHLPKGRSVGEKLANDAALDLAVGFELALDDSDPARSTDPDEARAAGLPDPDFKTLETAFGDTFKPQAFPDTEAARVYRDRSGPALRRFFDRELASASEALLFEARFMLEIDPDDGSEPVRVLGFIDRIDRLPDGSIEVIDYKTGSSKSQRDVDADDQLSMYALALREGAVLDPVTGQPLPAPSRLTLYFTESDLARSTTRSDEQLNEFRAQTLALAGRIRSGDFAANPDYRRCSWCEWRRLCPSRWGEA